MAEPVPITYKERAAFYDVEYIDDVDASFIESLVTDQTSSILEIPCGVGRNVLKLARMGRTIVAADIEPQMVHELSTRAKREGLANIEAVVADMASLSLGRLFDLIVVPREAFQLVSQPADAIKALAALRQHLTPHGRLMIDLSTFAKVRPDQSGLQPDYFDPDVPDGCWIDEWTRTDQSGLPLRRQRRQVRNRDGTIDITFRYSRPGGSEAIAQEASIRMRVYARTEFEALCQSVGLAASVVFGDYACRPYQTGDARIIFLLSRSEDQDESAPPSGVLWDVVRNFSNEHHSFRVRDIAELPQRPAVRAYFERYLAEYFSGPFLEGYGAEEILQLMSDHAGAGSALDLGAGTTSLFWYLPALAIDHVSCCDIAPEALAVLDGFVRERRDLPDCYRWVADHFGLADSQVNGARTRFGEYLVFDCIGAWPVWMSGQRFDLITAFGNFGVARSLDVYMRCFDSVRSHLNPGGRTIGADWVRRRSFAARDGHDNSYLNREAIMQSLEGAGLSPLSCRRVALVDDPLYEAVFVWAAVALERVD